MPTGWIAAASGPRIASGAPTCVRSPWRAGLNPGAGRCRLGLSGGGTLEADGVVVTGPGPPVTVPGQPAHHPLVLDGRSYWQHLGGMGHRARHIRRLGRGEAAAWGVLTRATPC